MHHKHWCDRRRIGRQATRVDIRDIREVVSAVSDFARKHSRRSNFVCDGGATSRRKNYRRLPCDWKKILRRRLADRIPIIDYSMSVTIPSRNPAALWRAKDVSKRDTAPPFSLVSLNSLNAKAVQFRDACCLHQQRLLLVYKSVVDPMMTPRTARAWPRDKMRDKNGARLHVRKFFGDPRKIACDFAWQK